VPASVASKTSQSALPWFGDGLTLDFDALWHEWHNNMMFLTIQLF
jgi:hypothetical protein